MAIAVALVSRTNNRAVYSLTHDGAAGDTAIIANATLLADLDKGNLYNKFNAVYANQAAMRAVFGGGEVEMRANIRTRAAAAAAAIAMDVDVDAVTPTKPEINITMTTALACTAYLVLDFIHSVIR
jgi:hypothetical protein